MVFKFSSGLSYGKNNSIMGSIIKKWDFDMLIMGLYYLHYGIMFFSIMILFILYYGLMLHPEWSVLWAFKVPIFEVPIMGSFKNSDDPAPHSLGSVKQGRSLLRHAPGKEIAQHGRSASLFEQPGIQIFGRRQQW